MNRDELETSTDDMIMCNYCGIAIDPAYGQMVYLVGLMEGFQFFHLGECSVAALKDAGVPAI